MGGGGWGGSWRDADNKGLLVLRERGKYFQLVRPPSDWKDAESGWGKKTPPPPLNSSREAAVRCRCVLVGRPAASRRLRVPRGGESHAWRQQQQHDCPAGALTSSCRQSHLHTHTEIYIQAHTYIYVYTVPLVNCVNDLLCDREINWICCTYAHNTYTVLSVNPVNDLLSDRKINWICCTYTETETDRHTHKQYRW